MVNPIETNIHGIVLVSGPISSGKSRLAEYFLSNHSKVTYIATGITNKTDLKWTNKIISHRKRRPKHWKTIESQKDLNTILTNIDSDSSVLIDSLGGYIVNHLDLKDIEWTDHKKLFLKTLYNSSINRLIVIVSEEVGWCPLPSTKIGCLFSERLTSLSKELSIQALDNWIAINGRALSLNQLGNLIP